MEKETLEAKGTDLEWTKKELIEEIKNNEWFLWKIKNKLFSIFKTTWKEETKEKFIVTKETLTPLLFSWNWDNFIHHLDDYILEWITRNEIAELALDWNKWYLVINNLEQFPELNQMDFIKKMIEKWEGSTITFYYEKFTEADDIEVADYLIEHGNGYSLMSEYKKFKWLNDNHIVKKLLEYNAYQAIIDFLEEFKWVDHQFIVDKIIESGNWYYVVEHLEKFKNIGSQTIAIKLIENWQSYCVAKNINKFWHLDQEILDKLIKNGYANEVLKKIHG